MARTEASILFVFNRQVQLVGANLVPGASRTSRSGFKHLFESQHRAVEFFGRGFQFRRDRDVHMMERGDHYSSLKFLMRALNSVDLFFGTLSVCHSLERKYFAR